MDTTKRESDSKGVLEQNIASIVAHRKREERGVHLRERLLSMIGRVTGSLWFVIAHLTMLSAWIIINLGWTALRPFDPDFLRLASIASIESLFLAMFVLLIQGRMTELAERRAELNLQISLLGEHEVTRILVLVNEIARKMDLGVANDPALSELQKLVSPDQILRKIEDEEKRINAQ